MTCGTWHVTRDMWHVTRDMWHVTCDMLWGVNILSKFQLPSSYGLWFMIFWRFGGKGWLTDSINQSITKVFVEQPDYSGSVKYLAMSWIKLQELTCKHRWDLGDSPSLIFPFHRPWWILGGEGYIYFFAFGNWIIQWIIIWWLCLFLYFFFFEKKYKSSNMRNMFFHQFLKRVHKDICKRSLHLGKGSKIKTGKLSTFCG